MNDYTIEHFVELESRIWAALASGDAAADAELLTEDFLGVYESGFADKEDHLAQLAEGPVIASYNLADARIQVLTEGLVLLAYRAYFVSFEDQQAESQEEIYVSSLWRHENGIWKNSFSQDTPAIFD